MTQKFEGWTTKLSMMVAFLCGNKLSLSDRGHMLLDKKKKIRPRVSFLRQFFLYPLRPLKNSTRTDMLTIHLTLSWNMFSFKNSSFSKVRYSVTTSPSNSWLKFVFATRVNCLNSFRLSWIYLFFFDDCLSSNIFQHLALTVDLRLSDWKSLLGFRALLRVLPQPN